MKHRNLNCQKASGDAPQKRLIPGRRRWVSLCLVSALIVLGVRPPLDACGPNFPNWLLSGDSILAAPFASFTAEIVALKTSPPRYIARLTTNDFSQRSLEAELGDLQAALARNRKSTAEIEFILQSHAVERRKLAAFATAMNDWREQQTWVPAPNAPPSGLAGAMAVSGLPGEFADYFRGCVAWHNGDTNAARSAWLALLARPKEQRNFKSTWATYMLARSWEEADPSTSVRLYQQVRSLADAGFADSDGLAVASIGREARLRYLGGQFQPAIELYLQQQAAGEDATISLRWVAAAALRAGPSALKPLARDATARRVVTAYVIAGGYRDPETDVDGPAGEFFARTMEKVNVLPMPATGWHKLKAPALVWLEAIESAGVRDVHEAERFGLAAYQAGLFEQAIRWLDRAPLTPATRWLRAKLLLREGKVNEAAAMLAAVVRLLPAQKEAGGGGHGHPHGNLTLISNESGYGPADTGALRQVLEGELGTLRLMRREYTEALNALLRSGFWMDAAYVAERVLTVDELKTYVERHWPQTSPATNEITAQVEDQQTMGLRQDLPVRDAAGELRYLLARRLMRLNRFAEARPLFPAELLPQLEELRTNQLVGTDSGQAKESRAAALWRAAQILREHGMQLIGTEVEPDWHIYGGSFDHGVNLAGRVNAVPLRASADELQRAQAHGVNPETRFHYRYVAAKLAWEAAKLMPDNQDATARVLCITGSWLKDRDPKAADVFYKALVRRCRKTAIGAEADRKRWFPSLDETGALKASTSPRVQTEL